MKKIPSFKNSSICAAAFGVALTLNSHAALVIWGGSDGQYTTGANWVGGSVPNTNGGDTAQINSGNVTYTPGGDLAIHSGGVLHVNGGSWTQSGGIAWIQMGGGTLSVTGGVFNQGTAGNIVRNAASSITVGGGIANFSGNFLHDSTNLGAFSITGGTVNVANEFKPLTTFTLAGGSLTANLISFADGPGSIDFDSGNIAVNGAGFYSGFYGGGSKSLNFTSGSTGSLFFSTYTLADLAADGFLTNGTIRYNGAISGGSFSATESGGGVIITAVPEPTSPVFFLAGAAAVLYRRRRFQR
ncbi:MAG: PEP-CTERM sorting domain-containing protein [Verrucomicrobiota bacterium]